MPDLFDLIASWWKRMLLVILLALITVGIITFAKPRKYLSVATAVPASSFAADRSRIFNANIQALYSTLGTPDDLDMIVGTGALDTVYQSVAEQFGLTSHYKMKETGGAAIEKAAALLKQDTRVMKSEYGELKVKVWHTDRSLAAQLANGIMNTLNNIHRELQSQGNRSVLTSLQLAKSNLLEQKDSAVGNISSQQLRQEQLIEYEKLIVEYQLMVDSKPPVLVVVEQAKASNWPDKPKRMQIMIATATLSFLFALLAALIVERRKKINQ